MASVYKGPARLVIADAQRFDYQPFDVAVLFLCLMFIPKSERGDFLNRLHRLVKPGGAIIIFDKCEPLAGYAATVMYRLAIAGKIAAGVKPAEVISKELSLSGIQRPLSPGELPSESVEVFRFGDFAGWIIEAQKTKGRGRIKTGGDNP